MHRFMERKKHWLNAYRKQRLLVTCNKNKIYKRFYNGALTVQCYSYRAVVFPLFYPTRCSLWVGLCDIICASYYGIKGRKAISIRCCERVWMGRFRDLLTQPYSVASYVRRLGVMMEESVIRVLQYSLSSATRTRVEILRSFDVLMLCV